MESFIKKNNLSDEKIILACSAGPDSMYLLYKILETDYKNNLVVAYFNHKTRPETDLEEDFLEKLCKKEGLSFESAECDFEKIKKLYPSKSFEELAREKRYQFFNALLNIYSAKYIMTAHHMDDKIETFMFNLLRGSKLTGLINMKPSPLAKSSPYPSHLPGGRGNNVGGILRPLLSLEKDEIVSYLDKNNLKYFIDETNFDTKITRNNLRLEIIPKFSEINPSFKKNINNLCSYFEEVKYHIDKEVSKFLNEQDFFYIKEFNTLSPLIQKETIRYIFYIRNNGSTIGLSESNIAEIIKFINGKNNKTFKEIKSLKMEKDNLVIRF